MGGDGTAGTPLTAACRAAGPFGAGEGRQREGRPVPRGRPSAAGPLAVRQQQRQRQDSRYPAHACRPGAGPPGRKGGRRRRRSGAAPRGCRSAAGGLPSSALAGPFLFAFRAYRAHQAAAGHREWWYRHEMCNRVAIPPLTMENTPFRSGLRRTRPAGRPVCPDRKEGSGLTRPRRGPRGRAGVRWRPDQNGIRYPTPPLPAHRTRLEHPRSLRVANKGATPTPGPERPGPLPLLGCPRSPRGADEQGQYGHGGTESRSGLAGIAPMGRPRASISAPPPASPYDGAYSRRSQGVYWSEGARCGPGGAPRARAGSDRPRPRARPGPPEARLPTAAPEERAPSRRCPSPCTPAARRPADGRERGIRLAVAAVPGPRETRLPTGGPGEPPLLVVAAPPPVTPATRHPASSPERGTCCAVAAPAGRRSSRAGRPGHHPCGKGRLVGPGRSRVGSDPLRSRRCSRPRRGGAALPGPRRRRRGVGGGRPASPFR